jgi:tetratricopeptide (TPR) repeat protein
MALYREGRLDEAAETFAQAAEHSPRFAPARYMLGEARRKGHDPEGAIAAYRQALALNPRDLDSWLRVAECRLQQGRLDEARQALDEAEAVQPDSPDVRYLERLLVEKRDSPADKS